MPIFEYSHCNTRLEKLSKAPLTLTCPECGKPMVRQFGVPAFQFTNGHGTSLGSLMSVASNPPKSY